VFTVIRLTPVGALETALDSSKPTYARVIGAVGAILAVVPVVGVLGDGVAEGVSLGSGAAKGAGEASDVVYHYTTEAAAKAIQRTGLWSQSSATDVGTYTAEEATKILGVKGPAEVVIEIKNGGQFIANRPAIVQPHPLGPGGGLDLINPVRLSPQSIISVRPIPP
jgi:hypothetical protein